VHHSPVLAAFARLNDVHENCIDGDGGISDLQSNLAACRGSSTFQGTYTHEVWKGQLRL